MNDSNSAIRPAAEETLISVVLPAYNEALVLPVLMARVAEVLKNRGVDYEIIFVNDGSRDESAGILDHLAAANHRVRVVHLSRNFGHQAAVQAGLARARGHAIVLMDSDMQDAPEAIPQFIARWRAGYDVVYAVRTRRKESAAKQFLFAAFHRLLSRVAAVPIPIDAGNFGLIDRRVARQIVAMGESDRYYPGLRSWVGFRQVGVEVERNARYDRQTRVSLRGLFRLAKTAIFSFSSLPLSLFYGIGLMAMVIFLLLSGFALYCKLFTDRAIPGWTSHVLTGSFFGALNAFGISMLGEYVTRIYDQVRQRPLYVVDRTVNVGAEGSAGATDAAGHIDEETGQNDAADRPYVELMAEAERLLAAAMPADAMAMPRDVTGVPPALPPDDSDATFPEAVIVPLFGERHEVR